MYRVLSFPYPYCLHYLGIVGRSSYFSSIGVGELYYEVG